jgi:hypothetical protein
VPACCDDGCVDFCNDATSCGACGKVCPEIVPGLGGICSLGTCAGESLFPVPYPGCDAN